ncbi:MAG: hypothetical protein IJT04_00580 [Bacteroidales bacterium]|nr:hypothetical protein [Bacteroidales bacterium]
MRKFCCSFPLILLFITLLFLPISLSAQRLRAFSNDPSLTKEEMRTLASTVPKEKQKETEEALAAFDAFWDSPEMTEEFQMHFIEMSNQMLRKNMRFFPNFDSYIKAYHAFVNSELTDYDRVWMRMIQYHITNDLANFGKVMNNYADIFSQNILYNTPSSRWTMYGTVVKMGLDKEPYLEFKDADLVGTGSRDSVEVIGTLGRYYPASTRFEGEKGTIYWYRAGFGSNVKAEFKNYTVDTRYPHVHVENALFYYPKFFAKPILGAVDDKAGLESNEDKVSYPRFKSYEDEIYISNIYRNVDYIGGFEMRGAMIRGFSGKGKMAELYISSSKKRHIVAVNAVHYLFKEETVRANDARVMVYIEEDSIYHPSANFLYNEKTSELLISRPKYGVGRSPFFDSYHRMDITAETMSWDVTTDKIEFKPLAGATNQSSATFESQNFFNNATMRNLQGSNDVNPLYTLYTIFNGRGFQPITYEDAVRAFNRPPEDVKALLIQFAADGFVEYDVNNNRILYRKKIAQYLNNDVNRKDFDNITLESKNHYASLDLTNNELTVRGCEYFVLSDAQIVNVYPVNETVVIKKDRDMSFSGRIIAGLFDFVTHSCEFDYEQFKVRMNDIDSLIMYVEDKNGPMNMYGEYRLTKVMSPIEDLAGTLYIDMPHNKSGKIDNPKYPYFSSSEGGRVYYDHPFTFNRHYDRKKFFYQLDLFTITNLDNFDTDSIRYEGQLISGGIFPDIRHELKVRPDFSLGFVHKTDGEFLAAYKGKGTYEGMIDLSNRGLRGKGTIKYLTSTTESDSLVFFLDATTGNATSHVVEEQMAGVEFPPAKVEYASLRWEPYADQMFVYTQSVPMSIFNETTLTGNSKLTPTGMFGTGTLNFNRADITSKLFSFKHHELFSDAADLRIYDLYQTNEFVFSTDNYNSHIDFQKRKGHFESNGKASEVIFVKNEFKTNAAKFDWDPIDEDILIFQWDDPYKNVDINSTPAKKLVDMESTGNELTATSAKKKGLQFTSTAAEFNFKTNIIQCHGVRYVHVGDAAIVPNNGEITILEYAEIKKLDSARIVADYENKYHELYDCSLTIVSGREFNGNGKYDYIDMNKEVQVLKFDSLWFYEYTKGYAPIPFDRDFKLSPHFAFDGRAELSSANEFLTFVGGVQLVHDCDTVQRARLQLNGQINPDHVLIEIGPHALDVNKQKAVVAIASANVSGRIYTCFGAHKDQFNDSEYISATGYIDFDEETQCFRAASMAKLEDPDIPENIITLNKKECIAQGSGSIDMGAKLGRVDFKTLGTVVNYMKADSAEMSLTTTIDFFFNEQSMKLMNTHIDNATAEFFDAWENEAYDLAMKTILKERDYEDYAYEVSVHGQAQKLPQDLRVKFVFANIGFVWNPALKAFVSQQKLPMVICNSKEVNKMLPGKIVIEKRGSRNKLYIYCEVNDVCFFFQFENNQVYGFSTDTRFTDAIRATKAQKRMLAGGDGKASFTYKLGNRGQKDKFLRKFYVKEEEPEADEETE